MVFIVLGLVLLAQNAKGDYRTSNLTHELLRMDYHFAVCVDRRRVEVHFVDVGGTEGAEIIDKLVHAVHTTRSEHTWMPWAQPARQLTTDIAAPTEDEDSAFSGAHAVPGSKIQCHLWSWSRYLQCAYPTCPACRYLARWKRPYFPG